LMALRVCTPLSEEEIRVALTAMRECFSEIQPLLKEVAPHLID